MSDRDSNSEEEESDTSSISSNEESNLTDDSLDPRTEGDYERFVRSVFCNDEDNLSIANSLLEEDEDDIEYNPDINNDDKEDDFELGADFLHVPEREVQDLVDGVWDTIVGNTETVIIDESNVTDNTNDRENQSINSNSEIIASSSSSTQAGQSSPAKKPKRSTDSNKRLKINREKSSTSLFFPNQSGQSSVFNVLSQIFTGEHPSDITIYGLPIDGLRKLAARQWSMATQLLVELLLISETNSDCFNKAFRSLMELSNYREKALKKAALIDMNLANVRSYRQAIDKNVEKKSMKNQLLFHQRKIRAITSINRNASDIRAAKALQAMKKRYGGRDDIEQDNLMSDSEVASPTKSSLGHQDSDADDNVLDDDGDDHSQQNASIYLPHESNDENENHPASQRITRASLAQLDNKLSISVADMPLLRQMTELFDMIDAARMKIKAISSPVTTQSLSSSLAERFRMIKADDSKVKIFQLVSDCAIDILAKLDTRCWHCLLPSIDNPLSSDDWMGFDATSIAGKSYFTPHEDELLLRGLVNHLTSMQLNKDNASDAVSNSDKDTTSSSSSLSSDKTRKHQVKFESVLLDVDKYPWSDIQTKLLPCKDEQALQSRYSQATTPSSSSSSSASSAVLNSSVDRLQEYMKLKERFIRDFEKSHKLTSQRWTIFEDMQLLRGYQVHGSKWHLINIFFVHNKSLKDIKTRWSVLLKQHNKLSDDLPQTITGVHAVESYQHGFLYELNHPSDTSNLNTLSAAVADIKHDIRANSSYSSSHHHNHDSSNLDIEDDYLDDDDVEVERVDHNPQPMKRPRINQNSTHMLADDIDIHIGNNEQSFLIANKDVDESEDSASIIVVDQRSKAFATSDEVEFSSFTNVTQFLSKALNEGVLTSPVKSSQPGHPHIHVPSSNHYATNKQENLYKGGGLFASVMAAAFK